MMTTSAARDFRYIIIGAGMAGILAAIKLLEEGKKNIVIYEKAARIGGTWRENTYPGLACDVPAHAYTYSFEPNPDWTQFFAPGPEIQAYFERVVEKYQLTPFIRFNEEVESCTFNNGGWDLVTKSGIKDRGDFIIAATGVLHHVRMPKINGMDAFKGAIFHSAQWDHSVPLDGKRIAIIGTGSTGAQIVCALSTRAEKLLHFQRTPQWIMHVPNGIFTEEQKAEFRSNPELLKYMQSTPEYEAMIEQFGAAITDADSSVMKAFEDVVKSNLEQSVSDPVLREKLRPNYRAACKRLIYSDEFYQAVQRPTVEVYVEGVDEIEPTGIRTKDGQLHELDVIVLATGFQADRFMRPMKITGRNGVTLEEAWAVRPTAYMAISIPDFPNFFMLNGPNGPVGNFSLIEIAETEWGYIDQLMYEVESGHCNEISASKQALESFDKERIAAAKKTIFGSGCQSWYLDAEGIPATWPWTRPHFRACMKKPDLSAYDMR